MHINYPHRQKRITQLNAVILVTNREVALLENITTELHSNYAKTGMSP